MLLDSDCGALFGLATSSEPEHEVSSSSSVASIPREKCTFKTNKRPSRVTAKELRGQLSSKFQTIIRFYGTLCN